MTVNATASHVVEINLGTGGDVVRNRVNFYRKNILELPRYGHHRVILLSTL